MTVASIAIGLTLGDAVFWVCMLGALGLGLLVTGVVVVLAVIDRRLEKKGAYDHWQKSSNIRR